MKRFLKKSLLFMSLLSDIIIQTMTIFVYPKRFIGKFWMVRHISHYSLNGLTNVGNVNTVKVSWIPWNTNSLNKIVLTHVWILTKPSKTRVWHFSYTSSFPLVLQLTSVHQQNCLHNLITFYILLLLVVIIIMVIILTNHVYERFEFSLMLIFQNQFWSEFVWKCSTCANCFNVDT